MKSMLHPFCIEALTSNLSIFSKMKMSLKETNESVTNIKKPKHELNSIVSICNTFAHKRRPTKVKAAANSNKRGQRKVEGTVDDILSEQAIGIDAKPLECLDKMKTNNYDRGVDVEEKTYIGDANDIVLVDGDKSSNNEDIQRSKKNDLKTKAGPLSNNLNPTCEEFESGFSKQGIEIDCVADGQSSRPASTRSMTKRKLTQNGPNRSLRLGKRRKEAPSDAAMEIEVQEKADCGKEKTKTSSPLACVKNSFNIDDYDEVYLDGVRYFVILLYFTFTNCNTSLHLDDVSVSATGSTSNNLKSSFDTHA